MDYIIQSTLSTLVGLAVIITWFGTGYATIFIWHNFSAKVGEPNFFGGKMILGAIGGLVTFLLGMIVAYLSLRKRNDFQG